MPSSDAPPVPTKATCPFCTGRLNDHDAPNIASRIFFAQFNRFVACHTCKSVFRMVPGWMRLLFSSVLFGTAIFFAIVLVATAHIILWWLDKGNQLSSFSILLLGMIIGLLIYGGVRSSEQLFNYAFNNMLILVSHPDFDKDDLRS